MAEKDRCSLHLLFAIVTAAAGSGFQHGYNTGVINVPHEVLKAWLDKTYWYRTRSGMPVMWGMTASIMNVGGTIGGLMTGLFASKSGLKMSLIFNNIFFLAGAIFLMGVSKFYNSMAVMMTGRFIIGINCGLNSGLCPMYLSEISPVGLRGAIASVYQLMIAISILLAQIFGLNYILGNEENWHLLFLLPALFGFFQVIGLIFCPESPRYLITQRRDAFHAQKALKFLRNSDNVEDDMWAIQAEADANRALPKITLKHMFKERYLKVPLMIAVVMMLAQQFSGINAVFCYSTDIFSKAGLEENEAQYATIGIGCINVLVTIVSVCLVDIVGRRPLLLIGFGGMAIDTVLLSISLYFANSSPTSAPTLSWACVALTSIYIILFAIGAGSIPWFFVSEIFSQTARPTAVSLAVPVNFIANFIVTMSFPSVEALIGPFVFLIFAAFDVVFFVFIWKLVPETKNKTIEEITSHWK